MFTPGKLITGFYYYMVNWDELSAREKAEFMRICLSNGVNKLDDIRELYNSYRDGGSIHIKPENRGKFTALKKRTGKSASWFKAHGTPAQRKMATFALNARKWHHGDGGDLINDGDEYFGGVLPASSISERLPAVQSAEGRAIAERMAQRVVNGDLAIKDVPRRYQSYVEGEAKGAIPMRGYMDKATNVALGTLAMPLATMAVAEAAPLLAPGSALWSNPIMQQAVASEIGGRAVDLVSKDFTGKTWAENMSSAFDNATGLNSSDTFVGQMASEMTNPGYLLSPSHFITKVGVNRLPQAAFDNYANRLVKEGFTPNITENITATKPILKETTNIQPYEIADLGGGYMLKSLMRGNPLEKQLSKQGTVSVNNINALINKGSDIEKAVVEKVLQSDEFIGKKSIDYNKFRKAVQDELVTYDRTPDVRHEDYGLDRLYPDPAGSSAGWFGFVKPETYTFSSSQIPRGSAKHYNPNTLGHSRTYTTADEPNILHVMESQSDWAQHYKDPSKQYDELILINQDRVNRLRSDLQRGSDIFGLPISETMMPELQRNLAKAEDDLAKSIAMKNQFTNQIAHERHLTSNFTKRQIEENLKFAAESGQTKMRYPTKETAAKIEGYSKYTLETDLEKELEERLRDFDKGTIEYDLMKSKIAKEIRSRKSPYSKRIQDLNRDKNNLLLSNDEVKKIDSNIKRLTNLENRWINGETTYKPEYETILDKYSEFPRQFKKIYKNADVRTITDDKGNTWYEVDVPKDYLKKEWEYAVIPLGLGAAVNKANKDKKDK